MLRFGLEGMCFYLFIVFCYYTGRYPVYDGYPVHVLDLQIRERNKILALGKEVARRESVLTALQHKLSEVI